MDGVAFKKPIGMKYTDMCIYIDKTAYKEDITEEEQNNIYQYIYHIYYVLACKGKFFRDFKDYNDFALYSASKMYARLFDERQFIPDRNGKTLDKVKSVLNYIKVTLYGTKVDYQKETFKQILDPAVDPRINTETISNNMKQAIQEQYNGELQNAIVEAISTLPEILKKLVENSPYKSDKLFLKQLYISCLISFLKGVTLNNENLDRITRRNLKGTDSSYLLTKLYKQEKEESTTVWKLPSETADYITVICNQARKAFSEELIRTRKSFDLTEEEMEAILNSAYEANNTDKEEYSFDERAA